MSEFYQDDERLGKVPLYPPFMKVRKIKQSRKEFTCEFCNGKIHKGSSCEYWVGIDLGKFYYYRICNECLKL
jgi:hypothetical protein